MEQGTPEWKQARAGCVTASRIVDVLRKPRRGQKESTTRKAYMAQLVSERLTGRPVETEFESFDTRRGKRLEPIARTEYELQQSEPIATVGFIEHPRIANAGCSPDMAVGEHGLAQIKCPRPHVHLDYILAGVVPPEHRPQMLFELACTGRKWNDFISYCEEMPPHLQLFVERLKLESCEAEIAEIEDEATRFLGDLEELIARLPGPGETALEAALKASNKKQVSAGRERQKGEDEAKPPADTLTGREASPSPMQKHRRGSKQGAGGPGITEDDILAVSK